MLQAYTGGVGFIGSHVVEACLAVGHEVTMVDDLSSGKRENLPERAPLYQVDVAEAEAVQSQGILLAVFRP